MDQGSGHNLIINTKHKIFIFDDNAFYLVIGGHTIKKAKMCIARVMGNYSSNLIITEKALRV